MKIVFLLSLLGVSFSYFIYPITLLLMPKKRLAKDDNPAKPSITLIITVHNEEARIEQKIRDSLLLDYPAELLEIIVASDTSTDDTDDIVLRYAGNGVRLVRAAERRGKEYAQSLAISEAKGDVLVFSDVATKIPNDSLLILAESYKYPLVGAVSSEDVVVSPSGEPQGEGAYVRYEMWLRRLESSRNSLIGLSGSFFSARRELCLSWDIALPSDLNTALNCARHGMVAVSNPKLLGYYSAIADDSKEYQRKHRTAIRGMSAIFGHPELMNPFKYGLFSYQIIGHKVMRWLVPVFMISLLSSSMLLAGSHWLYSSILLAQVLFYTLSFVGAVSERSRSSVIVKFAYFFVQVNAALGHAFAAYVMGKRITVWQPSRR